MLINQLKKTSVLAHFFLLQKAPKVLIRILKIGVPEVYKAKSRTPIMQIWRNSRRTGVPIPKVGVKDSIYGVYEKHGPYCKLCASYIIQHIVKGLFATWHISMFCSLCLTCNFIPTQILTIHVPANVLSAKIWQCYTTHIHVYVKYKFKFCIISGWWSAHKASKMVYTCIWRTDSCFSVRN